MQGGSMDNFSKVTKYEYHQSMIDNLTTLAINKKSKRFRAGIMQAIDFHKRQIASMTIEEGMKPID